MECEEVKEELRKWKIAAIALAVVLTVLVAALAVALVRRWIVKWNERQQMELLNKPWYYSTLEDGEGEFSDSISDTSSLFSPPFRANDGVVFKTAAANISDTQSYLIPSASMDRFDQLYDESDDISDSGEHRASFKSSAALDGATGATHTSPRQKQLPKQ